VARLARAPVPGGSVRSFRISADSRTVALAAERNAEHELTLLVAPLGGQAKAVEVAGPFAGGGSVLDYRPGAGERVLAYLADQDQRSVIELYVARPAAAAGTVKR
jgi:hypothetical protein